jgi:cell division protein FtsN
MARNYVKKPTLHNKKRRNFKHLLWMFGGFIAGYLIGSWYDFDHLQKWCWQQWKIYHDPVIVNKASTKQAAIPKPKFEFYTLLTNEHNTRVASAPPPSSPTPSQHVFTPPPLAANNAVKPVTKEAANSVHTNVATLMHESFVVQVASFQQLREAERLKVALLMKGFDVKITTIKQNNLAWYRVNMGPFNSKQEAQKAQATFAQRQHVMGMIRKMDG